MQKTYSYTYQASNKILFISWGRKGTKFYEETKKASSSNLWSFEIVAITEKLIKNKINCTQRVIVKAGSFSLEREERLLI